MTRIASTHVFVDGNNVMGSRPDGWWRDRSGAARRLIAELDPVEEVRRILLDISETTERHGDRRRFRDRAHLSPARGCEMT